MKQKRSNPKSCIKFNQTKSRSSGELINLKRNALSF